MVILSSQHVLRREGLEGGFKLGIQKQPTRRARYPIIVIEQQLKGKNSARCVAVAGSVLKYNIGISLVDDHGAKLENRISCTVAYKVE